MVKKTNKRVLVTGGAGYIGSHTIIELLNTGYDVVAVDNFINSKSFIIKRIKKISNKEFSFFEVDICDKQKFRIVFEKEKNIDAVIHFAALKSVGESIKKPLDYYKNNLFGLINLLELMDEFQVRDLIFSSSACVYGTPTELPLKESSAITKQESVYGNTKKIAEEIIADWCRARPDNRSVLLRYFNPIGAHPSGLIGELPQGAPNNLTPYITQTAIGKREILNVFGDDYDTPDGTCIRDYLHVVDLAKAHIKAMEYKSKRVSVFNLGTGKGTSVMEMIRMFEKVSGQKLNYKIVDRRAGDPPIVYADPSKANKELNWKCKLSIKQGLEDSWRWELGYQNKKYL